MSTFLVLTGWCPSASTQSLPVVSDQLTHSQRDSQQSSTTSHQRQFPASVSLAHAESPSPSSLSLATRPSTLPALRSHIKSTRHASVQIIPLNIVPNPLLRFSKIYSIQSSYPCYFIIHHSPAFSLPLLPYFQYPLSCLTCLYPGSTPHLLPISLSQNVPLLSISSHSCFISSHPAPLFFLYPHISSYFLSLSLSLSFSLLLYLINDNTLILPLFSQQIFFATDG